MRKLARIIHSVIETIIRNISGGLGQRIRFFYYSRRLKSCGRNVRIDEGVILQNPESIVIGNNVWILPYTILTGRGSDPIGANRSVQIKVGDEEPETKDPLLKIGDKTSIGAFNIIHGYGGLTIGSRVTTSARVSIYSFSHAPTDPDNPGLITYANSMVDDAPVACIVSPIVLEDGVWLGLGTSVFAGRIGENTFVAAHSVITGDLERNSYATGHPARRIKKRFDEHE